MAQIIGGFASSHTPLMYMEGKDWGKRGEQDRRNRELVVEAVDIGGIGLRAACERRRKSARRKRKTHKIRVEHRHEMMRGSR